VLVADEPEVLGWSAASSSPPLQAVTLRTNEDRETAEATRAERIRMCAA
jgi:hypothetical protein